MKTRPSSGRPAAHVAAIAAAVAVAVPTLSPAAEVFVSGWYGVSSYDTATGQRLTYTAIGDDITGVAFRSRGEMYVTDRTSPWRVSRLTLSGDTWSAASSREVDNSWRLDGVPFQKPVAMTRGPDGSFYVAAQNSHDVVAVGPDEIFIDENNVPHNLGPTASPYLGQGSNSPVSLSFPQDIAFDRYTLETAVPQFNGTIRIFQGANVARTLSVGTSVSGITYDFSGRPIMNDQGQFTGQVHSYLFAATPNGIYRYDAVTLEPMGSDPSNPTSPVFIPAGSGGLQYALDVAISPEDGFLYVTDSGSNSVRRYSPDNGSPAGRSGGAADAEIIPYIGTYISRLAFRPLDQKFNFENDGKFVLGPGGHFVPKPESDLTLSAAAGTHPQVSLVDDHTGHGNLSASAPQGGTINLSVDANTTYQISGNATAGQGAIINANGTLAANGVIATGGGNIIAAGDGNVIATGGGNVIATGGGNVIATGGGNVIASGGGNVIATGGGNVIATGGGNVIATGGGNLIGQAGGNAPSGLAVGLAAEPGVSAPSAPGESGGMFGGDGHMYAASMQLYARASVRPGLPVGTLTLHASLLMTDGATLGIELAGGSQYDRLAVLAGNTGTVHVDGTLEVSFLNGFGATVAPTDTFQVLTSDVAITGAFDNVAGGRVITADGRGSFAVGLSADQRALVLSAYLPSLPGDANHDGRVDADDYALIDRGFARGLAGWSNGDFDGDGDVDADDYLTVDTAYAAGTGTLSPAFLSEREARFGPAYVAALMAAVPEPSLLGTGLLAALTLGRVRRR